MLQNPETISFNNGNSFAYLPDFNYRIKVTTLYINNNLLLLVDRYSFGLISLIVPVNDHLSQATTFSCTKGGRLRESWM